ncbi:A disintegrin and metalloproteinase with thrombospondin motifs 18-like isoform X2 [Ptychodera flava]|uniref:A disintegrin and metalloproteinase with thrombospondin motifs 18-like isoform X2 n=1 Tax=Ptychodera flava TaxID=63121 RepID=UPI00396A211D
MDHHKDRYQPIIWNLCRMWIWGLFLIQGFMLSGGQALSAPTGRIEDPAAYEVVTPMQVDHIGNYLTHDLKPLRIKRSSEGKHQHHHHHHKSTFYKLSAFGEQFHFELEPNEKLLAPGFTVQVRSHGKSYTTKLDDQQAACLYNGKLKSHGNGSVAINTCNGLSGLLRTEDEEYLIEPLPSHLHEKHGVDQSQGQQPHMVYKRSTLHQIPKERGRQAMQKRLPTVYEQKGRANKQHYCGRRKKFQPHAIEDDDEPMRADEYVSVSTRQRRSLGNELSPRSVETLVVVDKAMLDNHGPENVTTTYVLTILNMVSTLFKDGSIGGNVNIVLVTLLLLDEEVPGLVINNHADHSLNSFCQWQSSLQTTNGSRHDHAILLTGLDICSWKNEPCDTLGFAPIKGMCSKYRSCTINEDTGLGMAFTIAHESGHNFGMIHDGEGNDCSKSQGHIMSPTLTGDRNGIFSWSVCSRDYLKDFLTTSKAFCLMNEPNSVAEYRFPEKLPGELYDADLQCKWQFGSRATLCTFDFGKNLCKELWCHKDDRRCETKFLPAAEGTSCGVNKWCRLGICVDYGQDGPVPIDGGWSGYSEYGECSRSCGGGVSFKERFCNNPRPQYGGKYCEGKTRDYQMCNIQECPEGDVDFRSQQCATYNSRPFRGFYYKWKPYTNVDREELCKLYCIAEDFDFFFAMSSKVTDGTPCREDSFDVCVAGKCQPVGCDHVLGSSAQVDSCGVCNGDNSTCDFVVGAFTHQPPHNDYYQVVTVPEGARNIIVEEMNISSSYLAIRNQDYKYYLTGDWTVDWPGEFKVAGTTFMYSREYNRPEALTAAGPTNEQLVIELLLQGINPGIQYLYTTPKPNTTSTPVPVHNYTWTAIMSECSATCAGGEMTTVAQCWRNQEVQVDDSFCDEDSKPKSGKYPCNKEPCPARWVVAEWQECNRVCGGGKQKRKVQCMQQRTQTYNKSVKKHFCPSQKPKKWQTCNTQECPPKWVPGKWSECSVTCGRGGRTRNVTCTSVDSKGSHRRLPESFCRYSPKPILTSPCSREECPIETQWFISAWSECSSTCGLGERTRQIKCSHLDVHGQYRQLPDEKCSSVNKPSLPLRKPCNSGMCMNEGQTDTKWFASEWSVCSTTCGSGIQTRQVSCMSTNQASIAAMCNSAEKPSTSQACTSQPCPGHDPGCTDQFDWCHLVPQYNVCNNKFYGQKCCKSCSMGKR